MLILGPDNFVVVQKLKHAGPGVRYRVECIHKQSVPAHPPSLPAPAVFGNTPEFKRWLLLKRKIYCSNTSSSLLLTLLTSDQL